MSWLYLGTFGSFIGYSAAFPKLIKTVFTDTDPLRYAFLGPLVGALARLVGGWISDKLGGARITFWNFLAMIGAVGGVLYFLNAHRFTGFFAMFLLLFIPITFGNAIKTGSPQTALIEFLVFYVTCVALTWWFYARRGAEAPC